MSSARRGGRKDVAEIARHVPKGLELGLRNYWYPVMHAEQLPVDKPVGFKVLNEELVAWRNSAGLPHVARDRCPHRSVKLSAGRVLGGDLQCAWHGLRFNGQGHCTLIPWESEQSPLLKEVCIGAYPAQELGGWIWVYIGDAEKFPPPPLAHVVPEELLHPEQFVVFRHPTDVWRANWLQALDGSDGFHAVMLHSDSQPVAGDVKDSKSLKRPLVPLVDRRMKVVNTPQGLRGLVLDHDGNQIHHGHFMEGWKGERWTLPGLFTIPLAPAPNLPAFVARVYQFPIDANETQSSRWVAMRATSDEERQRCTKLWNDIIGPRQRQVMREDQEIVETLGSLEESRASEFLFKEDRDVLMVRRMMADAWLAQLDGERPMPGKEAFVFPV
jgi:phenylpropionate dioxygenase-like ring-hydroxylating dioxygenase large terminal subunit